MTLMTFIKKVMNKWQSSGFFPYLFSRLLVKVEGLDTEA